jgi:hypothetical protein
MPDTSQAVHIDIASIPEFRGKELARSVLASLERAMSLPGAEEEFQAWLVEYRKEQAAKAAQRKE